MKAIFFDLDGTLLHGTREYRDVLADTFTAVNGEVRDEWIESYNEAFYELFRTCEPDPVRRAFASIEACTDPDSFVEELREREVKTFQPPENVHDDLGRLSEEYHLGVLTNGVPEWQQHKLRAHGLYRHFDAVVTSYEAGAHKPNPEPFRIAETRLPAEDYAMVGDDDVDVDGANRANWIAYRYRGGGFGDLPDALQWE